MITYVPPATQGPFALPIVPTLEQATSPSALASLRRRHWDLAAGWRDQAGVDPVRDYELDDAADDYEDQG